MADEIDPRMVVVVPDRAIGKKVAEWLTAKGFPSEVAMVGELAGPTGGLGLGDMPTPTLEVRVLNPDQVEDARKLIAESAAAAELRAIHEKRANRTGTVTATCEDCGKPSEWPAAEMGTTQICPHCTGYMDVPDPDDNWDDMDFGSGEAEDGSK